MQANGSNSVCPLCRNSASRTASGPPTNGASRLCESCRSLIAQVRPQSSPQTVQAAAVTRLTTPPPASSTPISQTNGAANLSPAAETDIETVYTQNGDASETPLKEMPFRFEPASITLPPASEQPLEFENPFVPPPVAATNGSGATNGWAAVDTRLETMKDNTAKDNFASSVATLENRDNLTLHTAPPLALQSVGQAQDAWAAETAAQAMRLDGTDINDIPPSWDEPVEYPILMVHKEETSRAKLLIPLAAGLLIAALAAAYFLVYQPYVANKGTQASVTEAPPAVKPAQNDASSQPSSQPSGPASEPQAAAIPPTSAATSSSATPPAATSPEAASATPPAATTGSDIPGQGNYSLQAASFPNQAGAKELLEKLIRAGVPAYLASANIAGKGQWYRVRVGRFASSTDAEKYAAQAKQRAKAAGLNLQLVVCDYAK